MSPMVAMRTASEIASVETPSSAATSLIGTTRSSGRSSSAVETTLAISGMRLAWLVSSAAACVDGSGIAPRDHQRELRAGRCPAGTRSGCRAPSTSVRLISCLILAWLSLRSSLGTRLMTSVALRTSAPLPITLPPLTNTLLTSGRAPMLSAMALVTALVSSMREPGGSSSASSVRPVSSAGRKPEGSR